MYICIYIYIYVCINIHFYKLPIWYSDNMGFFTIRFEFFSNGLNIDKNPVGHDVGKFQIFKKDGTFGVL